MKKIYKYSNGLTLIHQKLGNTPHVAFDIVFNVGGSCDPDGKDGISHFLEHAIFSGTPTYTTEQLWKIFRKYNAAVDAYTNRFNTVFTARVVAKYLDKIFKPMSDMLLNTAFYPEKIERERTVIFDEIEKSLDNEQKQFMRNFSKFYYRFIRKDRDVIGTKETVQSISIEDIKKHYKTYYNPANCIVSFAGNISFLQAKRFVDKYLTFPTYSDFEVVDNLYSQTPYLPKTGVYTQTTSKQQTKLVISFPTINSVSLDYLYPSILAVVLGGGPNSRLFNLLRNKHGLVYSVSSSYNVSKEGGSIDISVSCSEDKVPQVLSLIKSEIENIKQNGITQEELADEMLGFEISRITRNMNPSNVSNRNLNQLMHYNKLVSYKQIYTKFKTINNEKIKEFASTVFTNKYVQYGLLSNSLTKDIFKEFKLKNK